VFKVGDLFAGIGGVALGFEKAGMHVVWANEIDSRACTTYRYNFNHKLIEDDIHNLDKEKLDKIDVLCGGFPWQSFSIAGYRKGFDDDRGNLFFEIMRLAKQLKPKVIFLENVKNLKTHDNGKTFSIIKSCLEQNGYHVRYKIMNTCEYSNIPQNRERIYIIAFKHRTVYDNFTFPNKIKSLKPIHSLLEEEVADCFYYKNSSIYKQLKKEIINPNSIYQWRRIYVRENKSGVCPTLTANMGTGGHNVPLILDRKDIRKLTPRECLNFQGFPNNFKIPKELSKSSLYKQIGNSVSVPVIKSIAINIKKAMKVY
jgi:DNA (cytosine-5)-methyltransferase 1